MWSLFFVASSYLVAVSRVRYLVEVRRISTIVARRYEFVRTLTPDLLNLVCFCTARTMEDSEIVA